MTADRNCDFGAFIDCGRRHIFNCLFHDEFQPRSARKQKAQISFCESVKKQIIGRGRRSGDNRRNTEFERNLGYGNRFRQCGDY